MEDSSQLIAELFQRNKSTISHHIKNEFETGGLRTDKVVTAFATSIQHGVIQSKPQTHKTTFAFRLLSLVGIFVNERIYPAVFKQCFNGVLTPLKWR